MKKQGHNCSSSKAMAGSCLVRPAKSDGTEYNKGYKILETCYDTRNIYERAIKHYYRRDFLYFASGGNWCRQATAAVVEATRTGDNKSGLECGGYERHKARKHAKRYCMPNRGCLMEFWL